MRVHTKAGPALLLHQEGGGVVVREGRTLSPAEAGEIKLAPATLAVVEAVELAQLAGYQVAGLPRIRGPVSARKVEALKSSAATSAARRRSAGRVISAALRYLTAHGPSPAPEIAAGTELRYQVLLPALHREARRDGARVRQIGEGVGALWAVVVSAELTP